MRQFETLRRRYDMRSQWFQVGLASATLLTPLLKRWNDLRAAEQARAWRDEAEARLRDVRSWNPLRRKDARQKAREAIQQVTAPRGNVSATIWLAGVSVGLLAAGTGAFVIVRRRMRQLREEPMLDLPIPHNGNGAPPREVAQAVAQGIRQRDEQAARTMSAPAGNAATPTSTSTSTPAPSTAIPLPAAPSPQALAPAPAQAGPLMPPSSEAETTPTTTVQASEQSELEPLPNGATTRTESGATAGVADAESAAFIGNIHTMVYHAADADADDLPAEENRIYFASEDEAHERGYRRARDEVSSGGE